MARYEQSYRGERRTRSIGIKVTPTEREELEAAAEAVGLPLSAYVRGQCLKPSAAVAAATKRNPMARALLRELGAIGNNLNQLARHANTQDQLPSFAAIRAASEAVKNAMVHVIAL